ncbi:MAG: glycosyltransferase [Gammaproteobacteria bacterium]|nr:glycosyltransferase [Gammaproteobacteria bacterium]
MSVRLAHVITGLGAGGAEFMLLRLCARLVRNYQLEVISLTSDGPLAAHLRVLGIPVVELGVRGVHDLPRGMRALREALQAFRPDLIQTWLCHADLLGGLVARYGLRVPVIWGVHQAEIDPRSTPLSTRAVLRMCAWLSARVPTRVVSCSEAGKRARIAAGFPAGLFEVITNGVDLDLFQPRPTAGAHLRGMLGVAPDTRLVGLPARWHADKDHALLCAAARQVLEACPATCFVLCGEGVDVGNRELLHMLEATGHKAAFRLLGFQHDMPSLLAGLDVGVLSSRTEAFPNVIVETMACAVPFVATDVGDAAAIIGDCGRVARPGDAADLARALLELLAMPDAARVALGARARERALAHFSLAATVEAYDALYRSVLSRGQPLCAAS